VSQTWCRLRDPLSVAFACSGYQLHIDPAGARSSAVGTRTCRVPRLGDLRRVPINPTPGPHLPSRLPQLPEMTAFAARPAATLAAPRPRARWPATVLKVLLLQLLAQEAVSHGIMIQPRSRNWMAYLQTGFNYAHGLSAGGARRRRERGRARAAPRAANCRPAGGRASADSVEDRRPLSRCRV
jgi:hypothetical protein